MIYTFIAVFLVIIDQVTKYLVRANIPLGGSAPFIPHVLELTYIQNTGAAFSILEKHTWLLTLLSAIIVVIVGILVSRKFFVGKFGMLSATLIMAGGIGNLIDRVVLKYVTDMIKTIFMDFPVFNVADCCITIGVVMLFIYVLFLSDKDKKEAHDGTDLPTDHP